MPRREKGFLCYQSTQDTDKPAKKGYSMKVKKLAAAVAVAAPVGAALTAGAQSANALSGWCNDDVCVAVTYESGNVASIYMWAPRDEKGHFELTMPNGRTANSPSEQWYAGGRGYTFADWNGGYGRWCGQEWEHSLIGWTSEGKVCIVA